MRRAIALLITLLLLATLSLLLLHSYNISGNFSKNEKEIERFYQEVKILKDIKPIIKKKLNDINSSEAYDFIFSHNFPLKGKYIDIELAFSPVENRINLNKLIKNNKVNMPLKSLLEDILISYNLVDTNFFIDILLDTIDNDTNERVTDSEIATKDIFFRNGSIYNYKHFDKILDYYAQNRDDKSVYKIPWREFITFKGGGDIDINYAPLRLLRFLLPNNYIDKSFKNRHYNSFEELGVGEEDRQRLIKLGVGFTFRHILCKLTYKDSNGITFKKNFIINR